MMASITGCHLRPAHFVVGDDSSSAGDLRGPKAIYCRPLAGLPTLPSPSRRVLRLSQPCHSGEAIETAGPVLTFCLSIEEGSRLQRTGSAGALPAAVREATRGVIGSQSRHSGTTRIVCAGTTEVSEESSRGRLVPSNWQAAVAAALAAASTAAGAGPSLAAPALPPPAAAWAPNPAYGEVGSVLEASVQFLYLGALLALLGAGSFLVVRQVLVRRELENAAKELQERVRSGEAACEEYFELGAVMLRKKFYLLANRYLEQAISKWDGDEQDLAQVHNALGFSYFSEDRVDQALKQYEKAVKLQPGYVTAWNNLADAREKKKDWAGALKAYEEALGYDPQNRVATARADSLRDRLQRLQGIVTSKRD